MNKLVLYFLVACLAGGLLYFGLQNRPDPLWDEARSLLGKEYVMLDQSVDSAEVLYNQFHGLPQESPHDSSAFKILAKGYLPTMEWSKFRQYFDLVHQNKAAVIASINGSGASTLTNRLAYFIASSPEHVIEIKCAPQYDLILHAKYIGSEVSGKWEDGLLVKQWEQAKLHPEQRFVAIIDNFDKINPETFFGPEIWEILDDRSRKANLAGKEVQVPENFYLISVTHAGLSSKIEFTSEHFRRLGGQHLLDVSSSELVVYLRTRKIEQEAKLAKSADEKEREKLKQDLAILSDPQAMHRFLYSFMHANQLIESQYSASNQLGQWSNIRKLYKPTDFQAFINTFVSHIFSIRPDKPISTKDFDDLHYTLKTGGLAPRSSVIYRSMDFLQKTGYFVEITLILATSLITALLGWSMVRRREHILRKYGERTQEIFTNYEKHKVSPESAAEALRSIKNEIDSLVLSRKLNYTEALYFLGFIEDKVRVIEYARETAQTFQDLYDSFAEDGVFTHSEYKKMRGFLNSIRHRIPESEYKRFDMMVEQTRV